MALNIKDPAVDRLVRDLAARTGESITKAVETAARERLQRLEGAWPRERRRAAIVAIQHEVAQLPVLDDRTPEEILGYGRDGVPS